MYFSSNWAHRTFKKDGTIVLKVARPLYIAIWRFVWRTLEYTRYCNQKEYLRPLSCCVIPCLKMMKILLKINYMQIIKTIVVLEF